MTYLRLYLLQARDAQAQYLIERDFCEATYYLPCASQVLSDDNGLAVAMLTSWTSREAAHSFQDSGLNNLLAVATGRYTAGTAIVQLFRVIGE